MTMEFDDDLVDIVDEFLTESRELLEEADELLLRLDRNNHDTDAVTRLFRVLHTFKGTSASLGLGAIESVSHKAENVLSLVRDEVKEMTPERVTLMLATLDTLRQGLDTPSAQLAAPPAELDTPSAQLAAPPAELDTPSAQLAAPPAELDTSSAVGEGAPLSPTAAVSDPPMAEPAASAQEHDEHPAENGEGDGARSETSIRVDVALLDTIVGLVGELVLTRNQLFQRVGNSGDRALVRLLQDLSYITSSLQERALKTRMQRVDTAWKRLPRVVRDVAIASDKKVRLVTSGAEIELDRAVIEVIKDPLVHLVRNAVDHGLETPDVRVVAGKPEEGTLRLSASQDGGQVTIEIADDGRGVSIEAITKKALAMGIVTPAELANMSPGEITELILRPGFSTAEQVTKFSGSGVGLDVVKANLSEIRGTLAVRSVPGEGTTFRLSIPLSLAIVPAVVLSCRTHLLAVPQVSVRELVRLADDERGKQIEWLRNTPVLRLRGRLLPLVDLGDLMGIGGEERDRVTIVVVQCGGERPFGLVVDEVLRAEEIVVKPLSRQAQLAGLFGGATVMGDGSAALILDVSQVAEHARLEDAAAEINEANEQRTEDTGVATMRLLTGTVGGKRIAVPIDEIERLEKIDQTLIERVGDAQLVAYRDRLLPLVEVADLIGAVSTNGATGPRRVVVTAETGRYSVGLVVDAVVDAIAVPNDAFDLLGRADRHGIAGTVSLSEGIAELIDVEQIVRAIDPVALTALSTSLTGTEAGSS